MVDKIQVKHEIPTDTLDESKRTNSKCNEIIIQNKNSMEDYYETL